MALDYLNKSEATCEETLGYHLAESKYTHRNQNGFWQQSGWFHPL